MSGNIKDHILALLGGVDETQIGTGGQAGPIFPGGEINTASNVGTGLGWFKEKVGADLRFRSIVSDDPGLLSVTLSPDGNEIHLNVLGTHSSEGLQANYLVNPLITTTLSRGPLVFTADGADLQFVNLLGMGITIPADHNFPVVINGGAGGVSFTQSTKFEAVANNFKLATGSLGSPGSALELDYATGGINLYATGTSGINADIISLQSRLLNAVFSGAVSISAGGSFSVTAAGSIPIQSNSGDITFNDRWTPTAIKLSDSLNTSLLTTNKTLLGSINELFGRPYGGEANTASNVGTGSGLFKEKSGVDLRFKTLIAGSGVTITPDVDAVTISATGTGEANTASNLGTGAGVFASKSGVDLRFRSFISGEGIDIQESLNNITVNCTLTPGEVNTASNVGAGSGLFASKVGADLRFKTLIAGTNVSFSAGADSITINATDTGEANTASNIGTGSGVFASKVGIDLRFKTLIAGTNVSLSAGADSITINATDTGEANTASNVGAGSGLFASKSGVDLRFKTLIAGSGVTITPGVDAVTIAAAAGTGEANTASNLGATGEGLFASKVGVDLRFKKLKAGANVTLSADSESVTIAASGGGGSSVPFFATGYLLGQASSTIGLFCNATAANQANPSGLIPITRGTDTFANGQVAPLIVPANCNITAVRVACASAATGLGTVGAAPTLRLDFYRTNISSRTQIGGSVRVPCVSGVANIGTWNNLGGVAGFVIFELTLSTPIALLKNDLVGFEFVNESTSNNTINAISRAVVSVETTGV